MKTAGPVDILDCGLSGRSGNLSQFYRYWLVEEMPRERIFSNSESTDCGGMALVACSC
jgi:hypothetical protein